MKNWFDRRKLGEKDYVCGTVWLVEYLRATPCPVYARENGPLTCDPWEAKKFVAKEEAQAWMVRDGVVAFLPPWTAVEHKFLLGESAMKELMS